MAVSTRRRDLKGFTSGHKLLARQGAANQIDQRVAQMGQVAQGFVLDLAILAVSATQQMGAIDLVFVPTGGGDYVSCAIS